MPLKIEITTTDQVNICTVINWVHTELKPEKLLVLGHSVGGQLLGFADNIKQVDDLIPWKSRGQFFNANKLGLGIYPWPAAAAKQWVGWGQQIDYLFNPKFHFDLSPWHNFTKPILSLGFIDDDMAPEAAIDGLLQ